VESLSGWFNVPLCHIIGETLNGISLQKKKGQLFFFI